MPNFINEVYNDRFAPDFSFSMLTENVALVRDYVSETVLTDISYFGPYAEANNNGGERKVWIK